MAGENNRLLLWTGAGVLAASGLAYYFGVVDSAALLLVGVAAGVGSIGYVLVHRKGLRKFLDRVDAVGSKPDADDFDRMWSDLQAWAKKDPRNSELLWNQLESFYSVTVIEAQDEAFWIAVLQVRDRTAQGTDDLVAVAVELKTGFIVHWAPGVKMDPEQPFESIPIVQDLRRRERYAAVEVRRMLKRSRLGRLGGSYEIPGMDEEDEQ